jgi:uncharacterized membrane protein
MQGFDIPIFIHAPIDTVFAELVDIPRWPRWVPAIAEMKGLPPTPPGVGMRFQQINKFLGRTVIADLEITAMEPPRRFAYKSTRPFPGLLTWTLESQSPEMTKANLRVEAEPGGFFGMAAPMLITAVKRQMHEDIQRLKAQIEARR